MKAELVPDNGDPPIAITKDLSVVGRRGYCDIVVEDPSISKRHCILVKTDGLLVIRDLGSTNGTKVKGQRIRWAALLPDDRISLGSYKFRIYLGPDDTPGPSELVAIRKAKALANVPTTPDAPALMAANVPPAGTASDLSDATPRPTGSEAPTGPEGQIPGLAHEPGIDLAFANAKTPIDGQEIILEID